MLDAGNLVDVVTKLGDGNRLLGLLLRAIESGSPVATGTVTLDADASTTVTNDAVVVSSFIALTPINAAAATLVGSAKSPYTIAADGSFTIATANAAAAAGTEVFNWALFNLI